MHRPPAGPEYPVLHMQSVMDAFPGGADVCCGHGTQAALATLALYFAAGHSLQMVALSPSYPDVQTQLPKAELPAGDVEFEGHDVHVQELRPSEYVPLAHALQGAGPTSILYVPLAHASHASPLGPEKPLLH